MYRVRLNAFQIQAQKFFCLLSRMKVQKISIFRETHFYRNSCPSSKDSLCGNTLETVYHYILSLAPSLQNWPIIFAWNLCILTLSSLLLTVGHLIPFVNEQKVDFLFFFNTWDLEWTVLSFQAVSSGTYIKHPYPCRKWLIMTSLYWFSYDFPMKPPCNKNIFSPQPLTAILYKRYSQYFFTLPYRMGEKG